MLQFNKLTQTAFAAMCRLGEVYGSHRMSAFAIADASQLPRPIVAKVLTDLARAGLVCGARGPGGGFQLTRPPKQITLDEIVRLYDKRQSFLESKCPLGVKGCRLPGHCPLRMHQALFQSQLQHLLHENSLHSFTVRLCDPG